MSAMRIESYFDALARMFERALAVASKPPPASRDALVVRLDQVRQVSHNFGYGVGDDMDPTACEIGEQERLTALPGFHRPISAEID